MRLRAQEVSFESIMAFQLQAYGINALVSGPSMQTVGGLGYTTIMSTTMTSWTGGADGVD